MMPARSTIRDASTRAKPVASKNADASLTKPSNCQVRRDESAQEAPLTETASKQPLPLVVSVAEATRMLGIGKTSAYKLIATKQLAVAKIGARTLVVTESIHRLVRDSIRGA